MKWFHGSLKVVLLGGLLQPAVSLAVEDAKKPMPVGFATCAEEFFAESRSAIEDRSDFVDIRKYDEEHGSAWQIVIFHRPSGSVGLIARWIPVAKEFAPCSQVKETAELVEDLLGEPTIEALWSELGRLKAPAFRHAAPPTCSGQRYEVFSSSMLNSLSMKWKSCEDSKPFTDLERFLQSIEARLFAEVGSKSDPEPKQVR